MTGPSMRAGRLAPFLTPLEGSVGTTVDRSVFMEKTEVRVARCVGHLGHHLFRDGLPLAGLRCCINGVTPNFERTA